MSRYGRGISSSSSSSSLSSTIDELLSIDALRPWAYSGPRSPLKSQSQRWDDPAEVSVLPGRSSSSINSSRTNGKAASNAGLSALSSASVLSPSSALLPSAEPASKPPHTGKQRLGSGRGPLPTATASPDQSAECSTLPSSRDTRSEPSTSRAGSTVPDSEDELAAALATTRLLSAEDRETKSSTLLASRVFGEAWASPAPSRSRTANDTRKDSSSTTRKASEKRSKHRRLTIITILDSDEEAELAGKPSTTPPMPSLPGYHSGEALSTVAPVSPPALAVLPELSPSGGDSGSSQASASASTSSSTDTTPDEISFADYSDKEDNPLLAAAIADKSGPVRVLRVEDSSDSEYDGENGVLTWCVG